MKLIHPLKVAEITVAYKTKRNTIDPIQITSSLDALLYIREGFNFKTLGLQEQFVVMYLNNQQNILGIYRASQGGITSTVADIRIILSIALKIAATGIICAHNHPSGNLKPSKGDEELTIKLKEAARFMDIKVLDHLIIDPSANHFFSFADEGIV